MSQDTIPLPPELAGHERKLYVGTWLSEIRQSVELPGEDNAVLREIWVKLPSGLDRKWRTNESAFGALNGHPVGVLVSPGRTDHEFILGMVNFATSERRMFWALERPGTGCALWLLWMFSIWWVSMAWAEKGFLLGMALFAGLVFYSIRAHADRKKLRELDVQRLLYLAEVGAPNANLSGASADT